jgi:hypothetical protein
VYYYSDQIKGDEMGGAHNIHRKMRNAYKMSVPKSEVKKKPLGRTMHGWKDKNKISLKDVG